MSNPSLYIGNIDFETTEDDLINFCSAAGNVQSAVIARYGSGDSKGWGTVEMGSGADAVQAIQQLNGTELLGRSITVREDRGPTTSTRNNNASGMGGGGVDRPAPQLNPSSLHVSNLSWGTEDDGLFQFFANFGPRSAEVMIHEDSGRKKGWGLVHFETEQDASDAMTQLQGAELDGREVRIKVDGGQSFSPPPRRQRQRKQRQPRVREERKENSSGLNVFLGNLAWSVDDQMLNDLVKRYGSTSAEVMYGEGGRSRGYGIAQFATADAAQACVSALNGYEFEGRSMETRLDKFS